MEELEFEWHQRKRWTNLTKHGIDFEDAIGVFDGPVFVKRSDRSGERRFVAVGVVEGRVVAVTYTVRGDIYRIISARRARTNERRGYHAGKAAPGG
ncbi:MAG TPA: BrnT family toxin [Longimicrobium sp.]|jgi:hypothetical protein